MNSNLTMEYTEKEVEEALKQMGPHKSPGPDSFSVEFYQNHWPTVGAAVSEAVLAILNGMGMTSSLNSTFITLIPKVNIPTLVSEYRLVSLCNILYKIVPKVITNRLKHIMSLIISKNESVFIAGRLITDNILLTLELLHSMQKNRFGKLERMAVKLDMSKAYDRVEWRYLKAVLQRLGNLSNLLSFGKWVAWLNHPSY